MSIAWKAASASDSQVRGRLDRNGGWLGDHRPRGGGRQVRAALAAKQILRGRTGATLGTQPGQTRAALDAKLAARPVLVDAARTLHRRYHCPGHARDLVDAS